MRSPLVLERRFARRLHLGIGSAFCALTASLACTDPDPLASTDEIERAKLVYVACVEDELGMEVTELDIAPNGDISVEFGDGYTEEKEALSVSICESRIGSVLEPGGVSVLGPPDNAGRLGTDADVERLLQTRVELGFEGAVIAEFDGEPRSSVGYGRLSDSVPDAPNSDTAFDCGSIMKLVTAATIYLLEETGELSREQPLSDFFPEVPSVWASVTLEQLLRHTAGFDEYHDTEGDFEPMDKATALAAIFAQEPRFTPGTQTAYSNSGYTLLAIVIEEVTGDGYREVVRARIFEPLGMTRSGFYQDPLWAEGNVAVGRGDGEHAGNDPSRWPAPTWALLGNGGLVSTVSDLLTLAKGFDGGPLFADATRRAFHDQYLSRSAGSISGKRVIGYAGGNDFGFNAVVIQVPSDSTYVVAASHVLLPVTAEILGIELVQVLYGDVIGTSDDAD